MRAGVSKGTIYLYFPNKEALFEEMIRQSVIATIERAERELPDGSGTEQLRHYMRRSWKYLLTRDFEIVYRLTIGELHDFPALMRFFVEQAVMRNIRLLAGIIRRGVERGEFRRVDPLVTARMIQAVLTKHAFWAHRREVVPLVADRSDEVVLGEIMDFVFHSVAEPRVLERPKVPKVSKVSKVSKAAKVPSAPRRARRPS